MDVQRGGRAALNLSASHLAELAAELRPLLGGCILEELVGLPPRDVVLVFPARPEGAKAWRRLRVSAAQDAPRLHVQHARAARHDGPLGPFFRSAREELVGRALTGIETIADDRLVRLDFGGSSPARALVAELTGRRANLVLLDEEERVLSVLVPPPSERADTARLRVGEPWRAPPGGRGAPPSEALTDAFPDPPPAPKGATDAPLSWRVEASLGVFAQEAQREREVRELRQRIQRKLGRARSLVKGLEKKRVAAADAERVRQDGELLKANLGSTRRGMERLEVVDYFDPAAPTRTLALDPRRSPQQNLQKYFDRYQKLLRSQVNVEQELGIAAERLAALEELTERAAASDADPAALAEEATGRGLLDRKQTADPRKRKAVEPRKPYRQFTGCKGSDILVGRSAADNDRLSLKIARGNDVWLHTRDAPGSHVVLRTTRGVEPDPDEVLDAAHLAVHFSPLKEATRAAVHVAQRKHVHKPKGAKPGLVTLSGGRVLQVRMQPERVQRLLASARSPGPGPGGPATGRPGGDPRRSV